ncbi:MAG: PTS sugar transporter subunit IIA [Firmicutes bacterium]|nr:PTS sugar transporter subunit IIA [Bacillota bacterium]
MLHELLTGQTIQLGVDAPNWRAAIEEAGNLLARTGSVETGYVQAMIKMVEELGPYIVVAPGVALPHARPKDGVKRICMSLVSLSRPVSFWHPNYDPVDLIFALGAVDNSSHVEVMAQLAALLNDKERLARIRTAARRGAVSEVISAISQASAGSQ